jgi:hypothetical protein
MKRFLIVIAILAVGFACGQKESETTSSQEEAVTTEADREEPRQAIPDQRVVLSVIPTLKPYFDENGTVAEKMVSPGETFDLYVIIGCGESDHVTAAEYKLLMPAGITIESVVDTDSLVMKSGTPEKSMMVAFRCSPGPKIGLAKYKCLVGDGFAGGSIATIEGEKSNFIGVVDCGPDPVQISAEKGAAVLKMK